MGWGTLQASSIVLEKKMSLSGKPLCKYISSYMYICTEKINLRYLKIKITTMCIFLYESIRVLKNKWNRYKRIFGKNLKLKSA